ncbi:RNA-directed DNA polymerase, eukaryota [Tanacetum coccineum]
MVSTLDVQGRKSRTGRLYALSSTGRSDGYGVYIRLQAEQSRNVMVIWLDDQRMIDMVWFTIDVQRTSRMLRDILRRSTPGTQDRGCGYFMWMDDLRLHIISSSRSSGHLLILYPGTSDTSTLFSGTPIGHRISERRFIQLLDLPPIEAGEVGRKRGFLVAIGMKAVSSKEGAVHTDVVFSVASIQKEINRNRFQDVSLPTRWVKSVPIKVNIIAWKVKSNALPTRFNISRRGMDIDSIVCPICNAGVESTNHIFFQCVVVRQIMRKISSWWNIDYSDVNSYEEWQVWLVSIRIQSKLKGVLEGVYYGLWWYMWNFRNKLLFDKKIPEKALIFDNLVSSSFYWCKFRCEASFKWDD